MKKILVAVMAVAAIVFTSCNGKTDKGNAVDSTDVAAELTEGTAAAIADADALTGKLAEQLKNADPAQVQSILEEAKTKIAELAAQGNADAAAAYKAKIDEFITENAETLKSVAAGNETLSTLVTTITSMPSDAASLAEGAAAVAKESVENKVEEAKTDAVNKVNEAKENAENKVNEAVDNQKKKAADAIDNAAADAKKKLGL
ncbi:MAG: hypothetical protein IJ527_10590 [Prevotella sp.]|nr:hypothetical protein [Prevotella sp.]